MYNNANNGKRVFEIRINGIEKSIKDAALLRDALKSLSAVADEDIKAKAEELQNYDTAFIRFIESIDDYRNAADSLQYVFNGLSQGIIRSASLSLQELQTEFSDSFSSMADGAKRGSEEYENQLTKLAEVESVLTQNMHVEQGKRENNALKSNRTIAESYKKLFGSIKYHAAETIQALSSLTDSISSILSVQLDAMRESLDAVANRCAEVENLRRDSSQRIKKYEADIRDSQGETSSAVKEQLADELAYKADLDREEAVLAREKEKREKDIAKKEKEAKKIQLSQSIASATASLAESVIKAYTHGPILGAILAGVVAAAGAIQIGIMTKQLTKLEKGGQIKGKRHSQGGVRIYGTDIEVEGGEYVVNRVSTQMNRRLIEYINTSSHAVTYGEVQKLQTSANSAPIGITEKPDNIDEILRAIGNINFRPVVSVTDISRMQKNMDSVCDVVDFK